MYDDISKIEPFAVYAKMKRLGKKQKQMAKLFKVSESAVSQALKGSKKMEILLLKINKYLDFLLKKKGITQ